MLTVPSAFPVKLAVAVGELGMPLGDQLSDWFQTPKKSPPHVYWAAAGGAGARAAPRAKAIPVDLPNRLRAIGMRMVTPWKEAPPGGWSPPLTARPVDPGTRRAPNVE